MDSFFKAYVAVWSLACAAALILYLRRPRAFAISDLEYSATGHTPARAGLIFALPAIAAVLMFVL